MNLLRLLLLSALIFHCCAGFGLDDLAGTVVEGVKSAAKNTKRFAKKAGQVLEEMPKQVVAGAKKVFYGDSSDGPAKKNGPAPSPSASSKSKSAEAPRRGGWETPVKVAVRTEDCGEDVDSQKKLDAKCNARFDSKLEKLREMEEKVKSEKSEKKQADKAIELVDNVCGLMKEALECAEPFKKKCKLGYDHAKSWTDWFSDFGKVIEEETDYKLPECTGSSKDSGVDTTSFLPVFLFTTIVLI